MTALVGALLGALLQRVRSLGAWFHVRFRLGVDFELGGGGTSSTALSGKDAAVSDSVPELPPPK